MISAATSRGGLLAERGARARMQSACEACRRRPGRAAATRRASPSPRRRDRALPLSRVASPVVLPRSLATPSERG